MELFIRRSASGSKKAVITQHSVWNKDLFLAALQAEQRKLRDSGKAYQTIEIATEQDYREANWPKK